MSATPPSRLAPSVTAVVNTARASRIQLSLCVGAVIFLMWLDYYVNYSEWTDIGAIRRLCNMTREDALASWFQVTQTLLTGLTALLIWFSARHRRSGGWHSTGWLVVALFFLYMAVDDGAQVHERIGTAFDELRERGVGPGVLFPSYAWQILFVPLLGGVGLFMFAFLWRTLAGRAARLTVLLAIALQAAAVGLDFQEGLAPDHSLNVYSAIVNRWDFVEFADRQFGETPFDTVTHFSQSLEEGVEMISIALFWTLFIRRLAQEPRELMLRFTDPASPPSQA
ncbi:MAG: hypothetical protein Q7J25_13575 [Vicinamibacterales bacterium]|nr:hypothetical protein [Vicinamibacterales bacterium]